MRNPASGRHYPRLRNNDLETCWGVGRTLADIGPLGADIQATAEQAGQCFTDRKHIPLLPIRTLPQICPTTSTTGTDKFHFIQDIRSRIRAERFGRDQIDLSAEQFLKKEP